MANLRALRHQPPDTVQLPEGNEGGKFWLTVLRGTRVPKEASNGINQDESSRSEVALREALCCLMISPEISEEDLGKEKMWDTSVSGHCTEDLEPEARR